MTKISAEQYLEDRLAELMPKMGLSEWRITLKFDGIHSDSDESSTIQANCNACNQSKQATITFYLDSIEGLSDLDEALIHELCHCILAPIDDYSLMAIAASRRRTEGMLSIAASQAVELIACNLERTFSRLLSNSDG